MAKKKTSAESAVKPSTKPTMKPEKKETVPKELFDLTVQTYKGEIQRLKRFWICAAALAFFFGTFVQGNVDRAFSGGRQDRQEQKDTKRDTTSTSITRWVQREAPLGLKDDYPAVGNELDKTARRLRVGVLTGLNDSLADTIARVQPEVSKPDEWRLWLNRLGVQIEGGNAEKLAGQYDDAALGLGVKKAIKSLAEARVNDEKVDTQDTAEAGDSGSSLESPGRGEGEDKPVGSGENKESVSTADGSGKSTGAGTACANGRCKTWSPVTSYPAYYGGAW